MSFDVALVVALYDMGTNVCQPHPSTKDHDGKDG